jgi:D-aspartate ligase
MTMAQSRSDLLPVILGGDISCHAYAREFHEAFGVRSAILGTGFAAAVEHSRILEKHLLPSFAPDQLLHALLELGSSAPGARMPIVVSTDALAEALEAIRDELPPQFVLPIPSREAFARACDKSEFMAMCAVHGLPTPQTEIVRLAGSNAIPPTQIRFPVVAKAARSAGYSHLFSKGFRKVYRMNSQAELDDLWAALRAAGFSGDFLVQELIGGDDTHMGALTLYVDAGGSLRLFSAAQTLLEDHAPTMRGNSVAMVSRPMCDMVPKVENLLSDLRYTGFAEIDMKRDPVTGEWLFFELNPRVGRNSYYVVGAGANPMQVMVADLVDGEKHSLVRAEDPCLYSIVPDCLLMRYLTDSSLAAEVRGLIRDGRRVDPQRYAPDMSLRRRLDVDLTEWNQLRKFRRYYPKPTENSF